MKHLLTLSLITFVASTPLLSRQDGSSYDCIPGMACWPTEAQWATFNVTVEGRLRKTIPYAAPCYVNHPAYDFAQCQAVQQNYTSGTARSNVYGAMEGIQYEACGTSDCQLVSVAPFLPPLFQQCELGRMSAYYVDALVSRHVEETLKFVARWNIRLSIKNTGHDYLGRSSVPNSVALWTHNMKEMKYYQSWTAKDCPRIAKTNIGEIGKWHSRA